MKSIEKMSDRELRLEVMALRTQLIDTKHDVYLLRELIDCRPEPATLVKEAEPFMTLYPRFDYRRKPRSQRLAEFVALLRTSDKQEPERIVHIEAVDTFEGVMFEIESDLLQDQRTKKNQDSVSGPG